VQKSCESAAQLLKAWISWAVGNNIHLDNLDNLPSSRRYYTMARIERDLAIEPRGEIATALRPEIDVDTRETALWLNNLLHGIYRTVR
jgi:hypothetical protein